MRSRSNIIGATSMRKSLREWCPRAAFSLDDICRKRLEVEVVMRMRTKESGQVLVGAAVAFVVLMGFAGLAFDMGILRYERRLQQTAADAAALAEANELGNGGITSAGASSAAQANGFAGATVNLNTACPTSVTGLTVTVNNPPQTGPHASGANSADYVEVCVARPQQTYFMTLFGVNSEVVNARAVATNYSGATNGNNNYNCLITLGLPTNSIEGVNINGHADLNAPTCGIADNGNYNTKGNALTVEAGSFGVSGQSFTTGNGGSVTCTDGQTHCPQDGVPAASNPMGSLVMPCSPCTGGTALSLNGGGNVSPGTYTSISLQGNGNVNFAPGLYIINGPSGNGGSFTCNGTPTITGTGVTFYFTNGSTINCTGNDTANLTAPTSGTYQGILMMQDPLDCNCATGGCDNGVVSCGVGPQLGGNVGSNYGGILYFPNDLITFFGNSVSYSVGVVISDALALSGNPTVNLQGQAGIPSGLPPSFTLTHATLVE